MKEGTCRDMETAEISNSAAITENSGIILEKVRQKKPSGENAGGPGEIYYKDSKNDLKKILLIVSWKN